MEPLSIATACLSLVGGTISLSKHIHQFAISTKDARKDMDAFSRELASLQLCIDSLQHEETVSRFPDGLKRSLGVIIRNCNDIVNQMNALLTKLSSGNLGRRVQWSFSSREEAERLRNNLEAHKSAIEIALSISAVAVGTNIQAETAAIKEDTSLLPIISQDTAQIGELRTEITALRFQIMQLAQPETQEQNPLERFLDESIAYTESIIEERSILQQEAAPSTLGHIALSEPTAASSDTTSIVSNPFSDAQSKHYAPSMFSTTTSLSEYWEPLLTPATTNPLAIKPDHHAIEAAHRTRKRFPKWKKEELDHLLQEAITYTGDDRDSPQQIARTTSLLNLGAKIVSCNSYSSDISSYGTLAQEIHFAARFPIVALLLSRGAKLIVKERFLRSAMLQPQPNKIAIPELLVNQGFCTDHECVKAAIQTFNLPYFDHCLRSEPSLATTGTMNLCVQEGWVTGIQTVQARTIADHYRIMRETSANTLMMNYNSVLQDISPNVSSRFVERCESILVHTTLNGTSTDHSALPATLTYAKTTHLAPSSPVLEAELRQHVVDELDRQFPKHFSEVFLTGHSKKEVERVRNVAVTMHKRKMYDVCAAVAKERARLVYLRRFNDGRHRVEEIKHSKR